MPPRSATFSHSASSTSLSSTARASAGNVLLQQLDLVLENWRGVPLREQHQQKSNHGPQKQRDAAATSPDQQDAWLEHSAHNVETCRAAMALYASAAGPFAETLRGITDYLVDVAQHLASERAKSVALVEELRKEIRKNNAAVAAPAAGPGGGAVVVASRSLHSQASASMRASAASSVNPASHHVAADISSSSEMMVPASSEVVAACAGATAASSSLVGTPAAAALLAPSAVRVPSALGGSDDAAKCEYAFSRLEHAKEQMRGIVEESHRVQAALQGEIAALQTKLQKREEQLEYQILRMRKSDAKQMSLDEFERELSLMECQKQLEREKAKVERALEENSEQREKIQRLLRLNEKYARQAVELGARVRVYADHNERLATHLSLVSEERAVTERENEMIRAELLDLNRFHQFKDQYEDGAVNGRIGGGGGGRGGSLPGDGRPRGAMELRSQRYGRGANSTKPRHLQFTGLVNRISLNHTAVTAVVADVLMRRRAHLLDAEAKAMDLSTFLFQYMVKKHGNVDAIPWCYAVDEACSLHDDDPQLQTFALVVNGKISELVYAEMARDVALLVAACEVLDEAKNAGQGGDAKLIVSLADVVGLLFELFPGYPDSSHRRLLDQLMVTLTSNAQVHYRMLFPNLEREAISSGTDGILSQAEMRAETGFSAAFRQMFLDDVMNTTQAFEDVIVDATSSGSSLLTWADISLAVSSVFEEHIAAPEVMAMMRRCMFESFGPAASEPGFTVDKNAFLRNIVRKRLLLRRAPFRPLSLDPAAKRAKLLLSAVGRSSDTTLQTLAQGVMLEDFTAALKRVNKAQQRRSFLAEEEAMLQARQRKQSLLMSQGSEALLSGSFVGGLSSPPPPPPLGSPAGSFVGRRASFASNGAAAPATASASAPPSPSAAVATQLQQQQ